jgi:trigger factor
MQVKETLSEGLKREYQVVLPLAELDQRASERLDSIKDRVKMDGFRPGKVPLPHLKRVYGRSVMGEVIEQAISEANNKIISDGGFRLAMQPQIKLANEDEAVVKEIMEGKADLSYTVAMEILPKIELADFRSIKLERPVAPVEDAQIDETINKIAESNRNFTDKEGKVEKGDRVVMNFKGTLDGVPFEGGSADEVPLVIGSGSFIPGFEEQAIGMAKGETRKIKVTFPKNYGAEHLAGKDAEFEVTVTGLAGPDAVKIDDDFAKSLGLDGLEKLKGQVRGRLEQEYAALSRAKLKRALLDALDKAHRFDVPPTLVEQEFNGIWSSITQEMEKQGGSFADEGKTEDEAKEEYRRIADRRVRLGLVLGEVGEKNAIKVSDDELSRAIVDRARQYPGQEQQVFEHIKKNPEIVASIRAPLFEEKVVDYILELATITDKTVTREQLAAEDDDDADERKETKKKKKS